METDSTAVFHKVRNRSDEVPWVIKGRWRRCLKELFCRNFKISHIYREGNGVADVMANMGLTLSDFTWWYGVPNEAQKHYVRNINDVIEYRIK